MYSINNMKKLVSSFLIVVDSYYDSMLIYKQLEIVMIELSHINVCTCTKYIYISYIFYYGRIFVQLFMSSLKC